MSSRVLPRSPWFHYSFLKPIPSSTTVRHHSSLVSLPWTNFSFPIIHSFLYLRMHNSWYILHRQFLICYQRFMILFHALNSITKYLRIESSKFVSFDFKRSSILMKKWSLFARYPQWIFSPQIQGIDYNSFIFAPIMLPRKLWVFYLLIRFLEIFCDKRSVLW